MGNTAIVPFNPACFDDITSLAPLVSLLSGASIHYIIVWIFLYWNSGLIGGIVKFLVASIIFVCAYIQMVLDYIQSYHYRAFHEASDFADSWNRFNCQIFLFSSNGNMVHMTAFIACCIGAYLLDNDIIDEMSSNRHKTHYYAFLLLAAGDITATLLTPLTGGLITHTLFGSVIYIWFFAMFCLVCGLFCYCDLSIARSGRYQYGKKRIIYMLCVHVVTLCILWCGLLYYFIVNNAMIGLYQGQNYMSVWVNAWTERKWSGYLDKVESTGDWNDQFSFWFMLLGIGARSEGFKWDTHSYYVYGACYAIGAIIIFTIIYCVCFKLFKRCKSSRHSRAYEVVMATEPPDAYGTRY